MTLKKIISTTLFLSLLTSLFAIEPAPKQDVKISPEAKIILTKRDLAHQSHTIADIKSIQMVAKMEIKNHNLSGESKIISKENKVYSHSTIGPMTMEQGFNGKTAWSKDIMNGIRELQDSEKHQIIKSTIKGLLDPESLYDEVTKSDDIKFKDVDCYQLIYKKKEMKDSYYYIDKKTNQLLGMVATTSSIQGDIKVTTHFTEYGKAKEGFLYPKKMQVENALMIVNVEITEFKTNINVDDKIFEKPKN